jgi:F420-non-reducing hydrogenase small subunit
MEKSDVGSLKRWLEDIPCDDDKCFLSQGYLCLGSVTIDRCLLPCCPNQGMPCIGCAGPTPQVILEPNRDIRTEIAERISRLAIKKKEGEKEEKFEERLEERYKDVLKDIELFSKTHYAFVMASPLIHRKNTFNIKKWIHEAEEAKL